MVGTPYGGCAKGAIGLHRGMPSDDAHTAACDDRGVSPEFIHCDAALIVAAKPAGLLAVPGRGEDKQDCLAARVQAVYPDALVVHRLDMATSGLMAFARGPAAQRRLGDAFARREVDKRYVAIAAGRMTLTEGEIDLPLIADWPNRPRQHVDPVHGKPSLTRFHVLGHDAASDTTRVELEPVTGRSHQLRVHLCAIGHPIAGDALYAPPDVLALASRLMLHAQSLVLPHPARGLRVAFELPPPF
jgi:tRNA pseudouridine32 synthase/23S rRNA pseudouridine746 synthase